MKLGSVGPLSLQAWLLLRAVTGAPLPTVLHARDRRHGGRPCGSSPEFLSGPCEPGRPCRGADVEPGDPFAISLKTHRSPVSSLLSAGYSSRPCVPSHSPSYAAASTRGSSGHLLAALAPPRGPCAVALTPGIGFLGSWHSPASEVF